MHSSDELATLSAREAALLLGVKAQTLYAYASRGLVRRTGDGKRRRYVLEDLQKLRARQRARSGHGAVAADALAFGQPVLDTALSAIDERGPLYRGTPAVELARAGHGFEAVAELLWTGALPSRAPRWEPASQRRRKRPPLGSLEELLLALPELLFDAPERHVRAREVELSLARSSITRISARVSGAPNATVSVAARLATLARAPQPRAVAALDTALVLLADHELNASSFAARVAASTDASLPACLLAALATLSGARHGGACARVEALLDEAARLKAPTEVIERRVSRGDAIPGFGHPLYPRGDPRAVVLLELAEQLAKGALRSRLGPTLVLARTLAKLGLPATVDYGLVALTRVLGMKPGSAGLVFAVGRCAGWVAHVLEQRESPLLLRPRARYVPGGPQ